MVAESDLVVDEVSEINKGPESDAYVVGAVLEEDGIVVVQYVERIRTVVAAEMYTVGVEIDAVEIVAVEIVAVETVAVEIGAVEFVVVEIVAVEIVGVETVAAAASVTAETVEAVAVNDHSER